MEKSAIASSKTKEVPCNLVDYEGPNEHKLNTSFCETCGHRFSVITLDEAKDYEYCPILTNSMAMADGSLAGIKAAVSTLPDVKLYPNAETQVTVEPPVPDNGVIIAPATREELEERRATGGRARVVGTITEVEEPRSGPDTGTKEVSGRPIAPNDTGIIGDGPVTGDKVVEGKK